MFLIGCKSQRSQMDCLDCLYFNDIELSGEEIAILKDNISLFYDDIFELEDFCLGHVIQSAQNDQRGLYRSSLLHPHFPKFYFIKGSKYLVVLKANKANSITFQNAVSDALKKYDSEFQEETLNEINSYLENQYD